MRNCRNRKANRGNSLLVKAGVSTRRQHDREGANRDERYVSILASMQSTQWSQACRQKRETR